MMQGGIKEKFLSEGLVSGKTKKTPKKISTPIIVSRIKMDCQPNVADI